MIKQRNIGICILLSIVTCGIYGLYWFVVLTASSSRWRQRNTEHGSDTEIKKKCDN